MTGFQRYRLPLGIGVVAAAAVITLYFFVIKEPLAETSVTGNTATPTQTANPDLRARRVFVEGLDRYIAADNHDDHNHDTIENTLYTYVSQGQPDLYTGTVQPGSFKAIDSMTAELLIDIEPAEVTYRLLLVGSSSATRAVASAECVPKDQQMNPDAVCRDWNSL